MFSSTVSNVLALVGLLGVMLVVAGETKALVIALHLAAGTKYRGRDQRKLVLLRFLWASPLLHEAFAARLRKQPAYRTFGAYLLFMLVLCVGAMVGYRESVGQLLGAGFIVSGTYFAVMYRQAFTKQRAVVDANHARGDALSFT